MASDTKMIAISIFLLNLDIIYFLKLQEGYLSRYFYFCQFFPRRYLSDHTNIQLLIVVNFAGNNGKSSINLF